MVQNMASFYLYEARSGVQMSLNLANDEIEPKKLDMVFRLIFKKFLIESR
jgi:hypothetical protein